MQVEDIKVFVPSKDFTVSQRFYRDIGFIGEPANDELVLFTNGDCQFFLQRFYDQSLAENLMLQICVADIRAAHQRCEQAADKQKITAITDEPWGQVFYLWGPSGELLHVTQLKSVEQSPEGIQEV
jgi:hypothetical protein